MIKMIKVHVRSGMDDYLLTLGSNIMNGGQLLNLLSHSNIIPIYLSTRMWIGGNYIPKDTILMFGDDYVVIVSDDWGSATIDEHEVPALQFTKVVNPIVMLD